MAIRVGQVRKINRTYITPLDNISFVDFPFTGSGTTFQDFAIHGNFETNKTYYVRVLIKRIDLNENMGETSNAGDNDPHNLNIDIKLFPEFSENSKYQTISEPLLIRPYYNSESATELEQENRFIDWCEACISVKGCSITDSPVSEITTVPDMDDYTPALNYYIPLRERNYNKRSQGDQKQSNIIIPYQTIELVFTPYKQSQYLVFQLRRVTYDYTISARKVQIVQDSTELTSDVVNITPYDIASINNILPISEVKKIGIQSKPGALVVINKEPMRIGKSGTLEINNGIPITSVSMIAPDDQVSDFILDYAYNPDDI